MSNLTKVKVVELAKLAKMSIATASLYFRKDDGEVLRDGKRIVGVSPEAAEGFLKQYAPDFYKGAIILSANLCGGTGKTTGIINLTAAARRLIDRKTTIVMIDGDAQGSLTDRICGQAANDGEPILMDYLEDRVKLDDILTLADEDNIWIIKSNLSNAQIEKIITKPMDVKRKMLNLYKELFAKFGNETKIFQDHHPDLSNLFSSSVCALQQLPDDINKIVLVPMRSDAFAISGAQKIIREIKELNATFGFENQVKIYCYFSNIDRRIPTVSSTLQLAATKEEVIQNFATAAIRYSDEIPKSMHERKNVFQTGKRSKATEDYNELLISIFSKNYQ